MIRARRMGFSSRRSEASAATEKEEYEWEVRPGGMLVQKRSVDPGSAVADAGSPVPTIRVKVKYESAYYEIYLGAQSTFGELKKLLAERTGLHHQEQKILYKDKERESSAFLDVCGVKDKSKLVMVMDPTTRVKRVLEMHRAAKLATVAKAVKDIAMEVDNLALQVRRVRKYVGMLDVLKIKNAKIVASMPSEKQNQHLKRQQQQQSPSVVVTTEWEMFDSSTSTSTSTTTSNSTTSSTIAPRSYWELF